LPFLFIAYLFKSAILALAFVRKSLRILIVSHAPEPFGECQVNRLFFFFRVFRVSRIFRVFCRFESRNLLVFSNKPVVFFAPQAVFYLLVVPI
jgi:hypothetical protein